MHGDNLSDKTGLPPYPNWQRMQVESLYTCAFDSRRKHGVKNVAAVVERLRRFTVTEDITGSNPVRRPKIGILCSRRQTDKARRFDRRIWGGDSLREYVEEKRLWNEN